MHTFLSVVLFWKMRSLLSNCPLLKVDLRQRAWQALQWLRFKVCLLKCDAILKKVNSPVQLSTLKSRPQAESMTGIIGVAIQSPHIYFLKCNDILKNDYSLVEVLMTAFWSVMLFWKLKRCLSSCPLLKVCLSIWNVVSSPDVYFLKCDAVVKNWEVSCPVVHFQK